MHPQEWAKIPRCLLATLQLSYIRDNEIRIVEMKQEKESMVTRSSCPNYISKNYSSRHILMLGN